MNKKGSVMGSMFSIILVLSLFFLLYGAVGYIISDIIQFSSDSTITFMFQMLVPCILIGILKGIYDLGATGQ